MADGSIRDCKPHNHHEGQDNTDLIRNFRNVLKTRASNENQLLKAIYDEECQR